MHGDGGDCSARGLDTYHHFGFAITIGELLWTWGMVVGDIAGKEYVMSVRAVRSFDGLLFACRIGICSMTVCSSLCVIGPCMPLIDQFVSECPMIGAVSMP